MNLDLGAPSVVGCVRLRVWRHKVRQSMQCVRDGTKRELAQCKRNEDRDFLTSNQWERQRNLLQKFLSQFGEVEATSRLHPPLFISLTIFILSGRVVILFYYFHPFKSKYKRIYFSSPPGVDTASNKTIGSREKRTYNWNHDDTS